MAVIRLQVEVDSEVYPELYERLRAIARPQAREERMRQLAASGLAWESVRLQGGVTVSAAAPVAPVAAVAAVAAVPPVAEPPRARPRKRPPPARPENLPVLVDVVADVPPPRPPEDEPPLPPPLDGGLHPPGPRSARLKRMLDRGLFKNG
jgi:hypothetical protein